MSANMPLPNTFLSAKPGVVTIVLGVLMAFVFLFFGITHLIGPDDPGSYLDLNTLNTRICVIVTFIGVVSVYALFRPYSGGIILCICAVSLGFIIYAIEVLILAVPILLIGVLSVIRGRLSRRTVSEEPGQPS